MVALLFNHYQHNDELLALAKHSAELSFANIDNIRRWNFNNDGIYIPTEHEGPDQLVTNTGLRLQHLVTSQLLSQMQSHNKSNIETAGVYSRITGLDPINPENSPDTWEKQQLEASIDNYETIAALTTVEGEPYYRVIRPIPSGPQCLDCHQNTSLNSNATMGAFSVSVPLLPIKATLHKKQLGIAISLLVLWLIGCIGIATTTKYILKRIKLNDMAREELCRSNNLYNALVATNYAIVKQLPRQKLFEKACQIAVRYGGFKLAWVGIVNEETQQVESVARAGSMGQYVNDIIVSIDPNSEQGCGPTSIAIRENRPIIVENFLQELAGTPWYEPAQRAGISSSAAFPIRFQDKVIGAFKLYADTGDFFSEKLISLLEQMTSDVSFALENLEQQQKFVAAQKLNQTLIDALPYPAILARFSNHHVVIANRKALEMGVVVGEVNNCCPVPENSQGKNLLIKERQRHNGQWDMICWCPVDDEEKGELYLHFAVDITDRKKQEAQINDIANRDALTGLNNRRYFNERLRAELAKSVGDEVTTLTLVLMDLNGFKLVNDTHGHPVGDELLIQISRRLHSVLRDCDILCRWGGDEFVVMLPNSSAEQAQALEQRLMHTFEQPFQLGQLSINSSCSLGMASYPENATTAEGLLQAVDQAMYDSKHKYYESREQNPRV
ncbi:MAG: diguanylate cyclase [Desulfuromonas sp.]|nr:diguanylate cyclase [Desulfuromonas sp.]